MMIARPGSWRLLDDGRSARIGVPDTVPSRAAVLGRRVPMPDDLLYFNGIDGSTGDYLTPPLPLDALSRLAAKDELEKELREELSRKYAIQQTPDYDIRAGLDRSNLSV